MISIIGIGFSRPPTVIDTKNGVFSTLNQNYIDDTSNHNVSKGVSHTVMTTTELAVEACQSAVKDAGINIEQIGLVIADCATPVETIPGESQRIACKLGLKIPAYDIISGSCALLNILQSLNAWKPERLPEYILIVSANSPTQRADFGKSAESRYFSDAASAAIVSLKHKGKLNLKRIVNFSEQVEQGAMKIDLFGHIDLNLEAASINYNYCLKKLNELMLSYSQNAHVVSDSYFNIPKDQAPLFPKQANSLGSGLLCALCENWSSFKPNDTILLFSVSLETKGGGVIILEVQS